MPGIDTGELGVLVIDIGEPTMASPPSIAVLISPPIMVVSETEHPKARYVKHIPIASPKRSFPRQLISLVQNDASSKSPNTNATPNRVYEAIAV